MKMKAFKHYGTVAALAVIILIFSILRPASFCTVKNFLNISRQAAPLAMVALGATFVMTINEFDLSIGNIVSLGGVIAALLSIKQVPVALCFLIAAVICLLVGCVNGIVVATSKSQVILKNRANTIVLRIGVAALPEERRKRIHLCALFVHTA